MPEKMNREDLCSSVICYSGQFVHERKSEKLQLNVMCTCPPEIIDYKTLNYANMRGCYIKGV